MGAVAKTLKTLSYRNIKRVSRCFYIKIITYNLLLLIGVSIGGVLRELVLLTKPFMVFVGVE